MLTLILIILPILLGFSVLFVKSEIRVKQIAFLSSLLQFGLTLVAYSQFKTAGSVSFEMNLCWIPQLGINFHIGVDGISLLMIILTNLLTPFIILAGFGRQQNKTNVLYALILFMQAALIGVFVSLNAFLFYIFWELALIPIYFIVLLWGGERREMITLKFFIYTLLGSLMMLAAFIYLYFQTPNGSFELADFYKLHLCGCVQQWLFWLIFIAFAIKMPIFPFHTWQPDTYTTAPTQGTMLLSGIMLKMGVFGVIRWLLPIMNVGVQMWGNYVIALSIIGIIYGAVIAFRQKDWKTMIAYSSISHVGLIAAGLFAGNIQALQGVMVQMLAHGINVIGLFFVIDIIQKNLNTRQIDELGGIKTVDRNFAVLFLIILLGSVALPLTNGFVGEFLLITGIYVYNAWFAAVAALTIIFGAIYMFYMYQKTMLGETNKLTKTFKNITFTEKVVLISLAILVIVFGVYPQPILNLTEAALQNILNLSLVH